MTAGPIRILHAADFHLDSAFGALTEEQARQRRQESRELLDRLTAQVKLEGAQLVLLPGDLFDGGHVYPETVERLRTALAAMDCPVFISPGNHDYYHPASPYATEKWPDNVHIFREEALAAVELPALGCVVYGGAFTAPSRQSRPLADFAAPADGRVHIACLHGVVDSGDSVYGSISQEELARSGLDYLALGHVHQCSVEGQGSARWAYPGCPEGRGFDELGDKGILVGAVEKGGARLRFVPMCRRRYRILEADTTGRTARQALESALAEASAEDICRVILTGETGEEGVDLAALERDFGGRCYALQLRDETRVAQDIWARAGEDSLRGLFLQELRRRYDAADPQDRKKIDLAVRFGLAALDGRDVG